MFFDWADAGKIFAALILTLFGAFIYVKCEAAIRGRSSKKSPAVAKTPSQDNTEVSS